MANKRIAIIGGGVSGLAMAYNLLNKPHFPCTVDIYEANDYLGGNADTATVNLGYLKDPEQRKAIGNADGDLIRFADLGVDDFNKATYTHIAAIMDEIKFYDYKPLEDTACFFTLDGQKVLTADENLKHGTSDPRFVVPEALSKTYGKFMSDAARAVTDPEQQKKYYRYTVKQFVEEYIADHADEKLLLEQMRDNLLYPRINAMYFAADTSGSGQLPLRSVMRYYIIQEGFDPDNPKPPTPERMYFLDGAQSWINKLAEYLEAKYEKRLHIFYNAQASVFVEKDRVQISVPPKSGVGLPKPESYDLVVMTTHADDALRSIKTGMTPDIVNMLDKVAYTNSIAVAHTFAGVLPPDRNAWRTYNVLIREGTAIHPYSMTYVMNRHRNDVENPKFNVAGMPQYFVTLNPVVPIPDEYVLKTPKGEQRKPAGYAKVLNENEERLPGWHYLEKGSVGEGEPVIGWFKHNVLDFNCLDAQDDLNDLQGGAYKNLFFAGGWSHGAGLHEECWIMAKQVAERISQQENIGCKSESTSEA